MQFESQCLGYYFDSALVTSTLLKLVAVVVAEVLVTFWLTSFRWLMKLVVVMIYFPLSPGDPPSNPGAES